ncbi:hypothetical protein ACHAQD_012525 [Fusarium lateritium]
MSKTLTISAVARKCKATFDRSLARDIKRGHEISVHREPEDARGKFDDRADNTPDTPATLLSQAIEQHQEISTYQMLEDSRGRFNVWADNIGALQEPSSKKSLDSRLKDAPVILSAFISGLDRLHLSLFRTTKQNV